MFLPTDEGARQAVLFQLTDKEDFAYLTQFTQALHSSDHACGFVGLSSDLC